MIGKTLDEGSTFERVGSRQLAGLLIAVWSVIFIGTSFTYYCCFVMSQKLNVMLYFHMLYRDTSAVCKSD